MGRVATSREPISFTKGAPVKTEEFAKTVGDIMFGEARSTLSAE